MASPKSCAILGHNPMRFAWGFDEEAAECHDMKMELAQQIMVLRQQGVTHFSVACDYGVGLYAAEIINALRNDDPELMLFCITPYEEQATKWTPELRERYFDMLIKGTHTHLVIGKELTIRAALSESHLYSSAFTIETSPTSPGGIPQTFTLNGRGWGHGVGLCQIGAAVMGAKGYPYDAILTHYFPGATIEAKW